MTATTRTVSNLGVPGSVTVNLARRLGLKKDPLKAPVGRRRAEGEPSTEATSTRPPRHRVAL